LITDDNELLTVGSGTFGQLGNQSLMQTKPTKITLPNGAKIASVSCGAFHTICIDQTKKVWAFGMALQGKCKFYSLLNGF
jgi:alpha-tubulin suppressor-like RCC1 family protein